MLRDEREVEADEQEPEVEPAEALVVHPAGHLREPVVEAREDREGHAAEERVVEVGDDVVAVVHLVVHRVVRDHDARQPADDEQARKPSAKSIGDAKLMLPRHSVAIQLKTFTPVGMATR